MGSYEQKYVKNMTLENIILLITTLLVGLSAGLFYSYSCSVNIGLGRLSDVEYAKAMQSINRAILNPWFFLIFMGPLLAFPISAWLSYDISLARFYWIIAAGLVYIVAVFGVTILRNVPLNDVLDKFNIAMASDSDITKQRAQFEGKWNKWHTIRTAASVLSFFLIVVACFL
jgi:uncharacterized membrane protein